MSHREGVHIILSGVNPKVHEALKKSGFYELLGKKNICDNYSALKSKGYEVIGVSVDSADSHKKFIEKHELPFTLIADTDKSLVNEMGVWGEKSMYGRKYMGTFRTTFIINEEGVVEKVFSPKEVKTKTHGEQLLAL
jgi:thioredoxin-dependent peroxiredoxin